MSLHFTQEGTMKIISKMDVEYGDYARRQYEVHVAEFSDQVKIRFKYLGEEGTAWPKGGRLELPRPVAARLAHAMLLASSGPLKDPVVFEVDEDKMA
jgi:hypothetical protein